MRITSKGQVTIPHDIREKLGLLPHTEVFFEVANGRAFPATERRAETERMMAHLRNAPKMTMSSKELLALLRDEPDELP